MNAPQFMAHVAFQQEVTDCRCALTDATQARQDFRRALNKGRAVPGTSNYVTGAAHVERVEQEFRNRLDAIQETRACALDRAGLTTPGLPR